MSIQNTSLSGRKKQVSNKEMTLGERLYIGAIAGGMATTFKHLFKKKVTISYPEETRPFSPVYRGQHMLMRDEEGRERCTACGLCGTALQRHQDTGRAAQEGGCCARWNPRPASSSQARCTSVKASLPTSASKQGQACQHAAACPQASAAAQGIAGSDCGA